VQTASQPLPSRSGARLAAPGRRWLGVAAWAAAVLLAAGAGLLAARLLSSAQAPAPVPVPALTDRELARDLRVVENQRLYEPVDDLEFLRQLDDPDLFGGDDVGW
jgi:hypothetical protein